MLYLDVQGYQKKQHEKDMISFKGPLDSKWHLTDIQFSSGYTLTGSDDPRHFQQIQIALLNIEKHPEVLGYWELVSGSSCS